MRRCSLFKTRNRTPKSYLEGRTTLVLDFVNEPEQIQESFQEYYQTTTLAEETDPNRLYDLQSELAEFAVYDEDTINQFCLIFYDPEQPDELLQGILDSVVESGRNLKEITERNFVPPCKVIFDATDTSHS